MITLGAKFYFGLTAFAVVAAMVLGLASGGTPLGVITFAWAGPVGDQFGFTVLVGIAIVAFFLGVVTTAFRDADPSAQSEIAGTETLPSARPPDHLSPWPVVAAVGVAVLLIGLVIEEALFGIGLVLIVAAAIEWTVGNWADNATGDPETNRVLRNRIMAPLELPAASLFGILVFVFFGSRVLLAASHWGAIAIFGIVATLILAVAALLVTRPTLSRSVVTAVVMVGAVALIGGGVIGLAAGEREFHDLSEEHEIEPQPRQEGDPPPGGVDETDPPGLGLDGDNDDNDDNNDGDDPTAGDSE